MALVTWLPLNDKVDIDLSRNESIYEYKNCQLDNNGIIGKSVSFNGNGSFIKIRNKLKNISKSFTISFWIKPGKSVPNWADVFSFTHDSNFRFEKTDIDMTYAIFSTQIGDKFLPTSITVFDKIIEEEWQHVTISYTKMNLKTFLNGKLHKEIITKNDLSAGFYNVSDFLYLGQRNDIGNCKWNGRLSDFRIYDEAISLKEIKEISHAKFIHYKMDNPYELKVDNIYKNTEPYNFDFKNEHSNFSMKKNKNGVYRVNVVCNKITDDRQVMSYPNIQFPAYKAKKGETYTLSLKARLLSSTYYDSGVTVRHASCSNDYGPSLKSANILEKGKWKDIVITRTFDKDEYIISGDGKNIQKLNPRLEIYMFVRRDKYQELTFEFKDIQLIKEDNKKPYLNGKKECVLKDCSGFNNNAVLVTNEEPIYSESSIKGYVSLDFKNSYFKTKLPQFSTDTLTINVYMNKDDFSFYQGVFEFTTTDITNGNFVGRLMSFDKNVINFHPIGLKDSAPYIDIGYTLNEWSMITCVINKDIYSVYLNGKKIISRNGSAQIKNYLMTEFVIGRNIIQGKDERFFEGKLNNISVYGTVLSDSEILSLYNSKASISKDGKVFVNSIQESDNKNAISKTIIIKSDGLDDDIKKALDSKIIFDNKTYKGLRSWNLMIIDNNLNFKEFISYDIFSNISKVPEFISKFDSIPDDYYIIILTNDEPKTNSEKIQEKLAIYSDSLLFERLSCRSAFYMILRKKDKKCIAENYVPHASLSDKLTTTGEDKYTLSINKNSLTKRSNMVSEEIDEVSIADMPIKYQYGATWARIYYLNSKDGTVIWNKNDINKILKIKETDRESYFYLLDKFYNSDGDIEFLMQADYTNNYNRWKQRSNPLNEGTCSGYEAIHIDIPGGNVESNFAGFRRELTNNKDKCYMSCSYGSNWWFAIFPFMKYTDETGIGVPYFKKTYGGKMEVWVRIDNIPRQVNICKNNKIQAKEFIEI